MTKLKAHSYDNGGLEELACYQGRADSEMRILRDDSGQLWLTSFDSGRPRKISVIAAAKHWIKWCAYTEWAKILISLIEKPAALKVGDDTVLNSAGELVDVEVLHRPKT